MVRWSALAAVVALGALGCHEGLDYVPAPPTPAPDAGVPCAAGEVQVCVTADGCPGVRRCVDGSLAACAAPAERCTGRDEDCDGRVDEGFAGLGETCTAGEGACAAAGRVVCLADGTAAACDAVAGEGTDELCNGIDDDCDGVVDEGIVDAPCRTDRPGRCAEGRSVCVDGAVVCAPSAAAADETCDGLDEDCDGRIDEGADGLPLVEACYGGPPETAGVGRCVTGSSVCTAGAPAACEGAVEPAEERCDGLDDDCDGAVDEGLGDACTCVPGAERPCYGGAPGTVDVGPCRAGRQVCGADGAWGFCVGEVRPRVETCAGLDLDCDGEVGDIPAAGAACAVGVGACEARGAVACVDGAAVCDASPGAPRGEICDGIDNDCDGVVDDVPTRGAPCTVGVGACARDGLTVCDIALRDLRCDAVAGPPAPEVCNLVDDDCDGIVDDVATVGDACAVGVGACAAEGRVVCDLAAGVAACDAVPGVPGAEGCDRIDDDCDGRVDEGPDGGALIVACYDGPVGTAGVGPCAPGVQRCVDGVFGACEGQVVPATEVCDDIDTDCDGLIGDIGGEADACDPAFCGNGLVDPGEGCDDGGRLAGDGCSAACAVEPGFVCEVVGFGLGVVDQIVQATAPDWRTSPDGLTVTQSRNSDPTMYSTSLPVGALYRAAIRVSVGVGSNDDDFIGWAVGAGERPLTAPEGPYLLFAWKRGAQFGFGRERLPGLWVSLVEGAVEPEGLWHSEGQNISLVARGARFGDAGWVEGQVYLVELVGDAERLRVYVDGVLEFDLAGPLPAGNLSFFNFSQALFRAELVGPLSLTVCRPLP